MRVIFPGCNLDSVTRLAAEILSNIVYDNYCLERSVQNVKVFNVMPWWTRYFISHLQGMLAIKSMGDGTLLIECVKDLVRILKEIKVFSE